MLRRLLEKRFGPLPPGLEELSERVLMQPLPNTDYACHLLKSSVDAPAMQDYDVTLKLLLQQSGLVMRELTGVTVAKRLDVDRKAPTIRRCPCSRRNMAWACTG